MLKHVLTTIGAAALLVAVAGGGCTKQGDCPAKTGITPGASCDDEDLQCAWDLATPSQACDGTNATVETSCLCQHGTWQCPSAFDCGGDDAGTTDDASADDGSSQEGAADDGSTDDVAASDAATDSAGDAPAE